MQTRSPNRIVFLSVPESLRGELADLKDPDSGDPFVIDPAIPIPVALEPGAANLDIEHLSWEMILSGMIRVVMDNPDDEDAPYYRRFVRAVKPNILIEFSQAAVIKTKNGDYDMALEIADALTGLFPRLAAAAFNRAFILEEQANALEQSGQEAEADAGYDTALHAYQKALALPLSFPPGLFNAGFFYMKRRNYDLSLKCFRAYLNTPPSEEFPEDPFKREQTRRILEEIEKHSLTDADFRDAYDHIRRGEAEQGLKKIRRFLEGHSGVWNGWFVLGWALRKLGRWEDGAAAFRKAVELGGGNSDTRNELAICLMELGDFKGARKELEICLRQEPDNVKIISNLGVLALKSGDDHEAARFFRTALELEPQDPVAREYFNRNPAHI
ncbi:MAG: tetratricopeptide repeat protein [Spirochaetaceae bacterium]|jgi:Flp pilus assembly protein TadD|nr:tetratricopeptide repeat protein [Spirochaetaceae bacterium]